MSKTIIKSGKRLMNTLNSLLDLSRIEANKQDIHLTKVNLISALSESIKLYQPAIYEKGLDLKTDLPETPVFLKADTELLSKIFDNLINNAIKYTPKGSITINAYRRQESTGEVVVVSVMDTGLGIKEKHRNLIFEPFRQASEGYSRVFEGTGLGLSITKRLVEIMDGSIAFSSIPGKGSTFSVKFPALAEEMENEKNHIETKTVMDTEIGELSEIVNILVVEDDDSNASVICSFLKDFVSVSHVFDGYEAIEKCNMKKFDGILMDINLRGISGIETAEHIRLIDKHYKSIPIIAMTAYAMKGDREKFLSIGFDYYISKPFDRSELLNLLAKIFKL